MKRLVLIGGGGFAKEVLEIAQLQGYDVIGYVAEHIGVVDIPFLGTVDELLKFQKELDEVVIAFGAVDRRSIARRKNLITLLDSKNFTFATLISPYAVVSQGVKVGIGSVIAHGVVVSVDAVISKHVVVNTSAIVGHDAFVGERTIIAPGAFVAGTVTIGCDCLIGPKSVILQGRKVGCNSIVSIGGSVLRDLDTGKTILPNSSKSID